MQKAVIKIKKILKIITIFLSLFFCSFTSVLTAFHSFVAYTGDSFIKDNPYGYIENFSETIKEVFFENNKVTIRNKKLVVEGVYKDYLLYDEEGNPFFEIRFVNCSDSELDAFYKKHYEKVYTDGYPRTKNYSFALFGTTKMCSYIYSPTQYESYKLFKRKIIGNYSSFSEDFSFFDFTVENNKIETFKSAFNNFGSGIEKIEMRNLFLKLFLFSAATLSFFKLVIYFIFRFKIKLEHLAIDCCVALFFSIINIFYLHFAGTEIIVLLAFIISSFINILLEANRGRKRT